MVWWFEWQQRGQQLQVYIGADWAGCKASRKSTPGGCVMHGGHTLKCWSENQANVALSSGESELYALVKASSEGLGMQSFMKDLGKIMDGHVWADASAALGIINRKGLGKLRHIQTNYLWVQDVAATRAVKYHKILGTDSRADLFTKYLGFATILKHCEALSCVFSGGRAESAPTTVSMLMNKLSEILSVTQQSTAEASNDEGWWL